jgi:hypothetical protein
MVDPLFNCRNAWSACRWVAWHRATTVLLLSASTTAGQVHPRLPSWLTHSAAAPQRCLQHLCQRRQQHNPGLAAAPTACGSVAQQQQAPAQAQGLAVQTPGRDPDKSGAAATASKQVDQTFLLWAFCATTFDCSAHAARCQFRDCCSSTMGCRDRKGCCCMLRHTLLCSFASMIPCCVLQQLWPACTAAQTACSRV